ENIIKYRDHYNNELRDIGWEAPTPKAGQKGGNYRRTSLQHFVDHLLPQYHELAKLNYLDVPYDILKVFEPQVLKACVVEYQTPTNVLPGELRKIERKDGYGHHLMTDWIGRESFVKAMGRPGRRVVSFRTDQGYVDASGRGLR